MKRSIRHNELITVSIFILIIFICYLVALYINYINCSYTNLLAMCSILFVGLLTLYIYRKRVIRFITHQYIKDLIDFGLISIGAYEQTRGDYVLTPEVKITDSEIIIDGFNPYIMNKLVSYDDNLSVLLPNNWIVEETYKSSNEKEFIIKYRNLKTYSRKKFESVSQFITEVKRSKKNEFIFDNDKTIDLLDTPHLLITGTTGSGKSYFAQELIYQSLIKRFDVYILDYKRSYQAFSKLAKVSYSIEDIEKSLQKVIDELHKRQIEMDEHLKTNPRAIATDYGYPYLIVFFEEYLAVINSNADKNTLKRIESMVLELTTTGRSLGISLVMILQQASASSLNSSIRSNLSFKIALGNCSHSIMETTFGKSDLPKVTVKMNKGEGYYQDDYKIRRCSVPTLCFKEIDLLYAISSINSEFN